MNAKWQFGKAGFLSLMLGLLIWGQSYGQPPVTTLSPQAKLSLLTCAPGTELYSIFGHSAFRVQDPVSRLDWVYNYGVFEFDTPNFILKFARGKLRYYVLSYSYRHFHREYLTEGRAIKEQVLAVNDAQKKAIFEALMTNELPENKYYAYDFFFDNCSTRERDLLENALGADLRFHPRKDDDYGTYRDLIDPYLRNDVWADFGIDLLLGLPTDADAHQKGAVFLPDYLFEALASAEIKENGSWKPLVSETQTLLDLPATPVTAFQYSPHVLTWGIFTVALLFSFLGFKNGKAYKGFDIVFFLVLALLGTLMLLFWIGTNHQATYKNLNMLWAWPFYYILVFALIGNRRQHWVKHFAKLGLPAIGVVLASHWLLPQAFHAAVLPLMMTATLRLGMIWQRTKAS